MRNLHMMRALAKYNGNNFSALPITWLTFPCSWRPRCIGLGQPFTSDGSAWLQARGCTVDPPALPYYLQRAMGRRIQRRKGSGLLDFSRFAVYYCLPCSSVIE